MTFDVAGWPVSDGAPAGRAGRAGFVRVWRLELAKLARLLRVQALLTVLVLAPVVVAAGLSVQGAVPADTLFGQFVHESGFAVALVVLGFSGQWALPLVVSVVAGDIFSAEDHHGTWKTVLTRSRTRGEVFAGKALAVLTYCVVALVLLGAASVATAYTLGGHAVIGLSGQLVPAGRATTLLIESFALQLPPMIGFAALSMLFSIGARNSVVGIGAPVVLGLLFQVLALVNLPNTLRIALLGTPFQSWHGLWVQHPFDAPVWHGLLVSAVWALVCLVPSWLVFGLRAVRVSS